MKIAYINQLGTDIRTPPFNGPANHIRQVVSGLKELGHQVTVMVGLDGDYWITDDLESFRVVNNRQAGLKNAGFFERIIRRLQRNLHIPYTGWFDNYRFSMVCRHEFSGYDVILERISWMGYGTAIAAKKMGIPLVVEYNGDPLHDLDAKNQAPTGLQRQVAVNRYQFVLNNASKIIASGTGWSKNLIDKWRISPDKITTIENGTTLVDQLLRGDLKSFKTNENRAEEITIVYLGGFYPWHGTDLLLKAFRTNLELFSNIKLIMIGAGDGFQETQNLARQFELEKHITFTGQLSSEDFAPILANADIAVSPYCGWVEYSGLKLFDYKAAGLAIIASGENGAPVTINHGDTGLIIAPCDLQALTDTIHNLILDRNLRIKLGQNARKDSELNNTWKITSRKIETQLIETVSLKKGLKGQFSKGLSNE